jgi:hypothetical protein
VYLQQTILITLNVITKNLCVKGLTFESVIVGRLKWSNMEGLHVCG